MSDNSLLNALVALLEGRPKDARNMLRTPELNLGVSVLTTRLQVAIEKREAKAQIEVLKRVLGTTLRIEAPVVSREAYLSGVAEVERIIDDIIQQLES